MMTFLFCFFIDLNTGDIFPHTLHPLIFHLSLFLSLCFPFSFSSWRSFVKLQIWVFLPSAAVSSALSPRFQENSVVFKVLSAFTGGLCHQKRWHNLGFGHPPAFDRGVTTFTAFVYLSKSVPFTRHQRLVLTPSFREVWAFLTYKEPISITLHADKQGTSKKNPVLTRKLTVLLLFSCSVMSSSLWPRGLQHSRLSCPSLSPGVWSNSLSLSRWCHPTISSSVVPFSSCLQSFPGSGFFFPNESALCISWPKYWSFSFSISPSNEYLGLISFRIDWFDFLAVQGTLKSFLQHHNLKGSILRCSAFFVVQLSHLYMTTGKGMALTWWTFAGKVIFLLFNTVSRSVIAFLPRS